MEIDQLKSVTEEDQMEMMMMLQMDKLPEFYGSYNEVVPVANNGVEIPHFVASPSLNNMTAATTISFPGSSPVQETGAHSQGHGPVNLFSSRGTSSSGFSSNSHKKNSMAAMREMIFRIAALQPIHIDPESVKPPKRRNVKISKDPQSVAARHRRERISERIRILQRLVPGGTKMDTASMLDEAIHYVKFLKTQVQSLEKAATNGPTGMEFPVGMSGGSFVPMAKPCHEFEDTN